MEFRLVYPEISLALKVEFVCITIEVVSSTYAREDTLRPTESRYNI